MAEVKLKEETELWEPRGPCGSWGPAQERTHSEAWKLAHIKEEPEEVPFHMVTVKSEDDEDKSSVLHQRPTEETREEAHGAEAGCSSFCEEEQFKVEEEHLNDDGAESDWSWEWEAPLRQTLSERRTASTMEPKPGEAQVLCGGLGGALNLCSSLAPEGPDFWFQSVKQKLPVAPFAPVAPDAVKTDEDFVLHQRPTEANRGETNGAEAGCSSDPLTQFHSESEEHTDSSEDTDHSEDYSREQAPQKSDLLPPPDASGTDRPFGCSECDKRFRCNADLQRHMPVHTGARPFMCSVCVKCFKHKSDLTRHFRLLHHVCPVCDGVFTDNIYLNAHLRIHMEDGTLDPSLQINPDFSVVDNALTFKCSICDKTFKQKSDLTRHQRGKHHICPVCGKGFKRKLRLKEHLRMHVEDGTMDESALIKTVSPATTNGGTNVKKHKCGECGKMFLRTDHLQNHMLIHSGEKPFKCPICDREFRRVHQLQTHVRVHTGEKPFSCSVCLKTFTRKFCLEEHMHTHSNDKTYRCSVCEKGFTLPKGLRAHMRSHSGDKPYSCTVCDKGFKSNENMKRHMKTHSDDVTPDQLLKDMFSDKAEKPFRCSVCEKDFSEKVNLIRHIKITHAGERPFSCPCCDKTFGQRSNLERHMKTHTGEKPYSCTVCHKGFIQKHNLTVHMRTHAQDPAADQYITDPDPAGVQYSTAPNPAADQYSTDPNPAADQYSTYLDPAAVQYREEPAAVQYREEPEKLDY